MKNRVMSLLLLALIIITTIPARAAENRAVTVPIIMYHAVRPGKTGKDSITPWEFESDLKYFKDNGYETVTMSDVISYAEGAGTLPEQPVILSFDDGYYNNYKYVFPLLEKYEMCAVMSVISGAVDKFSEKPSKSVDYAHLTWEQINEMLESGLVEIQNHSYNLHSYGKGRVGCGQKKGEPLEKYNEVLREDVEKSQARIFEMTGQTPNTFAYPYGRYNDNTVEILKALGLKASLSCKYGVNRIGGEDGDELWSLRRICRSTGQSAGKLIGEALKTLKYR